MGNTYKLNENLTPRTTVRVKQSHRKFFKEHDRLNMSAVIREQLDKFIEDFDEEQYQKDIEDLDLDGGDQ